MQLISSVSLSIFVMTYLLASPIAFSQELVDANGVNFQINTPNVSKIYKSQFKDIVGEEAIIQDLAHLAEDTHVIQSIHGNYLYTLLPVKDSLFNEKRTESFEAVVDFGKLALKKWLITAAKTRGITKTDAEQKMWLEFVNNIDTKTSDEDISEYIKKNPHVKRRTHNEIIQEANDFDKTLKQAKARNTDIAAISKKIREFDKLLQYNTYPKNHDTFGILSSEFWEQQFDRAMVPDAYIVQFNFKIPNFKQNPKNMSGRTFIERGFDGARRTFGFFTKMFGSNTTNSLTFMYRPWIQHIRNLNTNEVTTSTDDPSTWYWETSSQYWYTKNIINKDKLNRTQFRVGVGMLWSNELTVLNEIKGGFISSSFDVKLLPSKPIVHTVPRPPQLPAPPLNLNQKIVAKLPKFPISLNLKVGQILPFEAVTLKGFKQIFNHTYVIGSIRVGIPFPGL